MIQIIHPIHTNDPFDPYRLPDGPHIPGLNEPTSKSTWAQDTALWMGVLGGPAAWLLHFHIGYVLAPHVCASHSSVWVHANSVFCLALCAAAFALAWRAMGAGGPVDDEFEMHKD